MYLAQPPAESIRVYNLDTRSFALQQHLEMSLLTSPDNIWVNQENGELLVGCHPVIKEVLQHLREPSKHTAPSQVLRVRMQVAEELTSLLWHSKDMRRRAIVPG